MGVQLRQGTSKAPPCSSVQAGTRHPQASCGPKALASRKTSMGPPEVVEKGERQRSGMVRVLWRVAEGKRRSR